MPTNTFTRRLAVVIATVAAAISIVAPIAALAHHTPTTATNGYDTSPGVMNRTAK